MLVKSREEIDFVRLMNRCESMVAKRENDWRLCKYIEALNEQLDVIRNLSALKPSKDDLHDYTKKVNFLKGITQVDQLDSPTQKLMATQLLSPISNSNFSQRNDLQQSQKYLKHDKTKEIYLQSQAKYATEIRNDLLGLNEASETQLRQRAAEANKKNFISNKTNDKGLSNDDVDLLVKYHHDAQEKIAEEMISLTRNLKENVQIAGSIVKKDIESLEASATIANKNFLNLQQSTNVITDYVKRSCQYWLWIMLALVCLTFLSMVIFIRLFPKK